MPTNFYPRQGLPAAGEYILAVVKDKNNGFYFSPTEYAEAHAFVVSATQKTGRMADAAYWESLAQACSAKTVHILAVRKAFWGRGEFGSAPYTSEVKRHCVGDCEGRGFKCRPNPDFDPSMPEGPGNARCKCDREAIVV
ncbi:hypothetical protein [Rubrimonas cliftonensis]|uniref:Uncharacterized protein n=1 Tax=Rubrimonas cliftonensis TaxID=89524 RepID=A0A1H4DIE0_9RHOB|nr:hypothetical protein [Rubrimonas cliftonensis]SEA72357.1 hypothetical protein SAMN05444370_11046 [Rubrimonas cliftonensis]